MRSLAAPFLALLFVASPTAAQDECDRARLEAEAHHAAREYREAAIAYVTIAREHPECGRLDEVLYDAAIDYEAARLLGRAIQVRSVLVRNFPDSPLTPRAIYLVAANYHAVGIYTNAAEWYQRFAEEYPAAALPLGRFMTRSGTTRDTCTDEELADPSGCAVARLALENAIFFQLSLGDREAASVAADLYVRGYRATHPSDTAQVVFSTRPPVPDDGPIEDPAAVETFLDAFLADYAGVVRLDEEARAHVELARAMLALERPRDADTELGRAIALVTPEALERVADGTDTGFLVALRARDAAAEAVVRRADLGALELPRVSAVSGGHTEAGIRAWAAGALTRWVRRVSTALAEREAAYQPAVDGEIPEWSVAGLERVGTLYHRALVAGRAVAMPAWADADDGLALALEDAVEEALRPLRDGALQHWTDCALFARRVRWFSYDAERCAAGAALLDPSQAGGDEIHGAPDHVFEALAPPGPVFRVGPASDE